MDAISRALLALRLARASFVHRRFTAPWCFASPGLHASAPTFDGHAGHVVTFHVVTEGECFVEVAGQPPMRLTAGDAVLFPHGHDHVLTSHPVLAPANEDRFGRDALGRVRQREPAGGPTTQVLCCYMVAEGHTSLIVRGLPRAVRVNARGPDGCSWFETAARQALLEMRSSRPGSEGLLSKLAEMLFVEMLRLHMDSRDGPAQGWLAGAGDRIVGAALDAIHAHPARAWTLASLAKHVASSRSVLAQRFQQLVGTPTMQYLTQWRMVLAANLLSRSNKTLVQVAGEVGYETDAAFSRAFRRQYGMPPATWRRRQPAGAPCAGPAGASQSARRRSAAANDCFQDAPSGNSDSVPGLVHAAPVANNHAQRKVAR